MPQFQLSIVVDAREGDLIELCKQHQIPITTRSLNVGDVCIQARLTNTTATMNDGEDIGRDGNETGEDDKFVCVIERKTLADFTASFRDGRYREQKERLTGVIAQGCKCVFMVEGIVPPRIPTECIAGNPAHMHGFPFKTIVSAVAGMLVRDNIDVCMTVSTVHTVLLIQQLLRRYEQQLNGTGQPAIVPASAMVGCVGVNRMAKRGAAVNPNVVFRAQLCAIPSIADVTARAIAAVINGPCELTRIIEQADKQQALASIADIPMHGDDKPASKRRKVGMHAAHQILQYWI